MGITDEQTIPGYFPAVTWLHFYLFYLSSESAWHVSSTLGNDFRWSVNRNTGEVSLGGAPSHHSAAQRVSPKRFAWGGGVCSSTLRQGCIKMERKMLALCSECWVWTFHAIKWRQSYTLVLSPPWTKEGLEIARWKECEAQRYVPLPTLEKLNHGSLLCLSSCPFRPSGHIYKGMPAMGWFLVLFFN